MGITKREKKIVDFICSSIAKESEKHILFKEKGPKEWMDALYFPSKKVLFSNVKLK